MPTPSGSNSPPRSPTRRVRTKSEKAKGKEVRREQKMARDDLEARLHRDGQRRTSERREKERTGPPEPSIFNPIDLETRPKQVQDQHRRNLGQVPLQHLKGFAKEKLSDPTALASSVQKRGAFYGAKAAAVDPNFGPSHLTAEGYGYYAGMTSLAGNTIQTGTNRTINNGIVEARKQARKSYPWETHYRYDNEKNHKSADEFHDQQKRNQLLAKQRHERQKLDVDSNTDSASSGGGWSSPEPQIGADPDRKVAPPAIIGGKLVQPMKPGTGSWNMGKKPKKSS